MKNKFCIYSTLFPKSKKFFKEFINSINLQTKQDFDLILCLNGTKLNSSYTDLIKVPYKLISCDLPMNKARVFALKKIMKNYEMITLLDSDDYMSKDRYELIRNKIKDNDFFVNNLHIFSKNKSKPKKWLSINKKKIKLKDIYSSNFIGLSNLTIKTKALKKVINLINPNLLALDWCIAKLLLIIKAKGIYDPNIVTYYRQYDQNVSNLNNFNKEQIIRDLDSKIKHYEYFLKFNIHNVKEINELKEKLIEIKKINKKNLKNFLNKNKTSWWSHI